LPFTTQAHTNHQLAASDDNRDKMAALHTFHWLDIRSIKHSHQPTIVNFHPKQSCL